MNCPQCHKYYTDRDNQESIEQAGECLHCDHLRSDIYGTESINVGDSDHNKEVPITDVTTEPKGEQIL